ncbi:hypothetical protein [Herpetosiphon llansteffanensis]|uniref:hypothetical protein n=1 Tax=Herpetosiphon llansteffanensis TaxID=2094568 RepID=UPI000D7CA5F1|nr:hypothetical protein [Herpetosiphon llansteffanensis]
MTVPPDPQPSLTALKNLLLGVGGVIPLVVAPLWFVGRQFSFGYYEALVIPRSELTWTLWDYGEFGWVAVTRALLLLLFSLGMWLVLVRSPRRGMVIIVLGLFAGGMTGGIAWLLGLRGWWPLVLGCTTGSLGATRSLWERGSQSLPATMRMPLFDGVSLLIVAMVIVLGTADMAFRAGQHQAYTDFRDTPLVADIILTKPLFGTTPVLPLSPTLGLYAYPQVVVVTINSDQYFVATALTPDCLPQTVHMVKLADIHSVAYQQASLATLPCGHGHTPITATLPLVLTSPMSHTVPLSRSP